MGGRPIAAGAGEHELELARLAAPRGEQAVARRPRRPILGAGRRGLLIRQCELDLIPQRRGGMEQQQVDVAAGGERMHDLELGAGQPRQPEQRQPGREVEQLRLGPQAHAGAGESFGRARDADPRAQRPPQLWLPAVAGAPRPVDEQRRAAGRVGVEQPGDQPHAGEAAARRGVEMGGDRLEPGFGGARLDRREQRPHDPLGGPRVGVGIDPGRGRKRAAEEPRRERELDVRADAVPSPGPGPDAEPCRQRLGQPSLHATGRNRDDLPLERVARGRGEDLAEGVGEPVGALCSVDVQHRLSVARFEPLSIRSRAANDDFAAIPGVL